MPPRSAPRPDAQGFTLVEILVAMVIGMIGMIIMLQVFATAEGQRRATTGTGDAQTSGAMALYDLQRDIRQSGYGFNSLSLLNCSLALGEPSNATLPALAPAIINPRRADNSLLLPAGDPNTDTLLIAFGDANGSPEGEAITDPSTPTLSVQTAADFRQGNRVISGPSSAAAVCPAIRLYFVRRVDGNWITVDWPRPNVTPPAPPAPFNALLFNLGAAPTIRAYAIRGGNLTVCDFLASNCSRAGNARNPAIWVPIASNIVSLRAQYGRDTAPPNGVDTWDGTTPASACDWVRVSALRLAVVARNSQVERSPITLAAPTWEGSAAVPINLSARANWQNYRYKVFETVVPIRNLPWMDRTGCP
jgi:type IV pilus assembly protein PilW